MRSRSGGRLIALLAVSVALAVDSGSPALPVTTATFPALTWSPPIDPPEAAAPPLIDTGTSESFGQDPSFHQAQRQDRPAIAVAWPGPDRRGPGPGHDVVLHVPILMYHRIVDSRTAHCPRPGLCVAPATFAAQLGLLAAAGWHTVTMASLAADLATGREPRRRTFVITNQTLLGITGSGKSATIAWTHRGGPAAHAHHRAEQDAGRPAGRRVPRVLPEEPGRVLRLVLRLLPARGVPPVDGHLHREGLVDQRRDRPAAPRATSRAPAADET